MKLASAKRIQPSSTPCSTPCAHGEGVQVTFFAHMAKVADITRKEFVFALRVSDTIVDQYFSGVKDCPFTRARKALNLFARKDRKWLIAPILGYIAGGDDFDGRILTPEQTVALEVLAKAVDKKCFGVGEQ